jgi:hypothetical protein
MTQIFISYGGDTRGDVEFLIRVLMAKGFDVWKPSRSTSNKQRMEAVKKCDVFLVLMTPYTTQDQQVQRECMQALSSKKTVVPILRSGKVFDIYRMLPYIDMQVLEDVPEALFAFLKEIIAYQKDKRAIQQEHATFDEITSANKPKELRDLAKAIRANFGGEQPRGITQEMKAVTPEDVKKD